MTAAASELPAPAFLDERLAHWAAATPDADAMSSAARGRGPSGTSGYAASRAPSVVSASAGATSCRSSTRTTPRVSS